MLSHLVSHVIIEETDVRNYSAARRILDGFKQGLSQIGRVFIAAANADTVLLKPQMNDA